MEGIESLLKGIEGVIDVSIISKDHYSEILGKEEQYEEPNNLVVNLGVRQVLRRNDVYALLKDNSFRGPNSPTVFLVEEADNDYNGNTITIDGKVYGILGEEIFDPYIDTDEETFPISETFVMSSRRRIHPSVPSYFILPPIGFLELEQKKRILSASPSTLSDDFIRDICNFSGNSDYGTLLIGFDSSWIISLTYYCKSFYRFLIR